MLPSGFPRVVVVVGGVVVGVVVVVVTVAIVVASLGVISVVCIV